MDARLYLDGEALDAASSTLIDETDCHVQLELPRMAEINGPGLVCQHCGELIEEGADVEPGAWAHVGDDAGRADCAECGDRIVWDGTSWQHEEPDETRGDHDAEPDEDWHEAQPSGLAWVNHANIWANEQAEEVTLTISLGDPRGALGITFRRLDDGRIALYMPRLGANPGMQHAELHPLTITHEDGSTFTVDNAYEVRA